MMGERPTKNPELEGLKRPEMDGRLPCYYHGLVFFCDFDRTKPYPSSHNHGSVENGCISNTSFI